jgi:hypothetical protein
MLACSQAFANHNADVNQGIIRVNIRIHVANVAKPLCDFFNGSEVVRCAVEGLSVGIAGADGVRFVPLLAVSHQLAIIQPAKVSLRQVTFAQGSDQQPRGPDVR